MPVAPLLQRIRQLIGEDQLEMAIQLLTDHVEGTPLLDEILLQQARYTRLLKQQRKGTSSQVEIDQELGKISKHLLAFVRQEESTLALINLEDTAPTFDLPSVLRIAFARTRVCELLLTTNAVDQWLAIGEVVMRTELGSRKLVVDCLNELSLCGWARKEKKDNLTKWQLTEEGYHKLSSIQGQ